MCVRLIRCWEYVLGMSAAGCIYEIYEALDVCGI